MKVYSVLVARGPVEARDTAVALAASLPITGILEETEEVVFYFEEGTDLEEIVAFYGDHPATSSLAWEEAKVEEQNWNAEFEASLQPVAITDSIVVAQSWNRHEVELGDRQVLVTIDPKMSFGTGHHETTRLVALLMEDLEIAGRSLLDAGTGTGILSIIAALKGASRIVAFDNNEWAEQNTRENIELNRVSDRITVFLGEMEEVGEEKFDLIVANIQTFVILPLLPSFVDHLAGKESRLITSGVLIEDLEELYDAAAKVGLVVEREVRENEWAGSRFRLT